MHYQRWAKHGDPLGGGRRKAKGERVECSVPECDLEAKSTGLCSAHYQRMRTTGTTDRIPKVCSVEGCEKRWFSTALCRTHYERWKEFGDPHMVRVCAIEGCSRPAPSGKRTWCLMHYTRWSKHGDVGDAEPRVFQPPREAAAGHLWCLTCRAELPIEDFHRDKRSASGYSCYCKSCHWDRHIADAYGITAAAYRSLYDRQGGVCLICRKPETATHQSGALRRLAVDHDHGCCPGKKSCGKCVRGLLCARCNSAIGLFDEDRDILLAAVEYVSRAPVPVATPKPRARKKRAAAPGQLDLWGEEAA
jgi:hypothetical protein